MQNVQAPTPDPDGDRACVHERLIDAPPEAVFAAFAAPERLARWWGPDGFTSTFECFELQAGGRWHLIMHGPDGTDYPNQNLIREVEAPRRVVVENLNDDHHFLLTITFTPQQGQTLVGWRQVFDSATHKNRVAAMVLPANEQNLNRLAAEVKAPG